MFICFLSRKKCWWLYYSSFPFDRTILALLYPSECFFTHPHTHEMSSNDVIEEKKQRKKLKFSVLLFVMVINTLTYVARKLKVMIMLVWRQKTSKMWLIVIFDANAGDKIHKNHMHIRYGMHTLWMVVVKTNEGIRLHPHYTHIAPHHKVNFHYEAIAYMHKFSRISNEWSHLIKLYPAHFFAVFANTVKWERCTNTHTPCVFGSIKQTEEGGWSALIVTWI